MASTTDSDDSNAAIQGTPEEVIRVANEIISSLERVFSSNESLSIKTLKRESTTWRVDIVEVGRDDGVTASDQTIENNLGRYDFSVDHILAHHTGTVSVHLTEDA